MATHSLLLLPGDGIGPEVMAEVDRVLAFLKKKTKAEFKTETALCGGCSIDPAGPCARRGFCCLEAMWRRTPEPRQLCRVS